MNSLLKLKLFAVLFLLATAFTPDIAKAEGRCPSGYFPIGGENGSALGCAPISSSNSGSGYPASRAPLRVFDNYFAAAGHENASDVWFSGNYDQYDEADQAALRACERDMGAGCKVLFHNVNSTVSIVRGMKGNIYWAYGKNFKAADKAALQYCREQQDYCVVINGFNAPPTDSSGQYFPPKGNFRSMFGTAAQPIDTSGIALKDLAVYLATGHSSAAESERAALAFCLSKSGRKCKVARTISNAFFMLRKMNADAIMISSSPTEQLVPEISKITCPKESECTVTAVISASQKGTFEHKPFEKRM